jgi:hypothetical protein
MLFASLTEMFVGGIDLSTALIGYFTPRPSSAMLL